MAVRRVEGKEQHSNKPMTYKEKRNQPWGEGAHEEDYITVK